MLLKFICLFKIFNIRMPYNHPIFKEFKSKEGPF